MQLYSPISLNFEVLDSSGSSPQPTYNYVFKDNELVASITSDSPRLPLIFADKLDTTRTENLDYLTKTFQNWISVEQINLTLNCDSYATGIDCYKAFYNCQSLKRLPQINDLILGYLPDYDFSCESMCENCFALEEISDNEVSSWQYNFQTPKLTKMFKNCYKLKHISDDLLKGFANVSYYFEANNFEQTFKNCFSLRKMLLPFPAEDNYVTDSYFSEDMLVNLSSLREISCYCEYDYYDFEYQELHLEQYIGYFENDISAALADVDISKEIVDDTTYNLYKNNSSSWTKNLAYSFLNKSTFEDFIQTLPEITSGTIYVTSGSGELTDSGSVDNFDTSLLPSGWEVQFT